MTSCGACIDGILTHAPLRLIPALALAGQLAFFAGADFEEHKQQPSTQPERYQHDRGHFAGDSPD
ncbi:MAG TPA: hypothetical protein VK691_01740 [Solirubrobacteraceae bacterium]|nr:hypothetical protein [Solirubrobacteraceae bacterium]